mgnify:CR=1 FL=1
MRVSLAAMNLSPPTSRMTCLALAVTPSALRLVMVRLGEGQWAALYISVGILWPENWADIFVSVWSLPKLCWRVNIEVESRLSCQLIMTINPEEINGISIPVF